MQKGNEKNEGTKNEVVFIEIIEIPKVGFLRVKQIIKIMSISESHWWAGVKEGRYPKPHKLSERVTVWFAQDIVELINKISSPEAA